MRQAGKPVELTNWTKSACSPCFVYKAGDLAGITQALAAARERRLSVIPHGAGHSYTDAALNTHGVVIDTTPMHRILSWDPTQGIMRVEPGVTLLDMVRKAWKDGWWPFVSPSTPQVTIGGCTAMNVNGKNAWKMGPFGAHIVSLDVFLPSGETCTLEPLRNPQLFHAFVGGLGLLGILTSITVQLQHISTGYVTVRRRSAASLAEIFSLFAEEQRNSDFIEAWLDGFAVGGQLGRGAMTSAALIDSDDAPFASLPAPGALDRLGPSLVSLGAKLGRPVALPGARVANRAFYDWGRWNSGSTSQVALFPFTFWPSAAFAGYHAMLPEGAETFQAFVPREHAEEIFTQLLRYSQGQGFRPIWCVIKRHQSDPFLLSYQVDGYSLELNYPRTRRTVQTLKPMLEHMIAMVIEAGGRFYLAKDHYLTHAQYRQSVGDEAVETFLRLKKCYDPEMLLQSDLFRRVFQP